MVKRLYFCPLCREGLMEETLVGDSHLRIGCLACGEYTFPTDFIEGLKELDLNGRAFLRHSLAKSKAEPFHLSASLLVKAQETPDLPTPLQQADLMVEAIGDRAQESSGRLYFAGKASAAVIGARDETDVEKLKTALERRGLIASEDNELMLTLDGWERYEEIKRGSIHSDRAFMAMPFRDDTVRRAYENHFRPAAAQTGFKLNKADEEPEAGSITDRMRVDIRNSRFVVAELSGANPNGYWEAGFARGARQARVLHMRAVVLRFRGRRRQGALRRRAVAHHRVGRGDAAAGGGESQGVNTKHSAGRGLDGGSGVRQ